MKLYGGRDICILNKISLCHQKSGQNRQMSDSMNHSTTNQIIFETMFLLAVLKLFQDRCLMEKGAIYCFQNMK